MKPTPWNETEARQGTEAIRRMAEKYGWGKEKPYKPPDGDTLYRPAQDSRYANKALQDELALLRSEPADGQHRNTQLNRSAFALGQLVAGGLLLRSEVEAQLADAASAIGLEPGETRSTIRSGLEAGMADPRGRPESGAEKEAAQVAAAVAEVIEPPAAVPDSRLPFPAQCFPEELARHIKEVAVSLSCPDDFPGVAMLAIAATAIGASRAISITRKWLECPRMYIAVVAEPGSAKSPAVGMIAEPMTDYQSVLHKEWEAKKDAYDEAAALWEAARRRKPREGDAPVVKPAKPVYRHLYTTDPTTESLVPMLRENPKGFMLLRDEVTGWVMSMNQYRAGKGADRQFWLSAWDGQPVKTDRKGTREEGSLIARYPFINVLGGVQPDMLSELCDERGREDGFVHRLLFSYPANQNWSDRIGEAPTLASECAWEAALKCLWSLKMQERLDGSVCPHVLCLTVGARRYADEWYADHAGERNADGFNPALIGPWSKMRSYFFRCALVIHLLRGVCGETSEDNVDEASVIKAAALMEYFKSHTASIYPRLYTRQEDRLAERALAWIQTRPDRQCSIRDLMRSHFVKRASEGLDLLKDLVDRGWGVIEQKEVGESKRKVDFFILHGANGH